MATYNDRFGTSSISQKRADLACNPFYDKEAILSAPDEDIIILHEHYFTTFGQVMMDSLGEDIFDEYDF